MNTHQNWLARQTWEHLLFLHWPVDIATLRPMVPESLEIDRFDGIAWVGIVLFEGKNNQTRKASRILSLKPFLELNVRTYVSYKGEPGVYFLSMDVDSLLVMTGARLLAGLPYYYAQMEYHRFDTSHRFSSERISKKRNNTRFSCSYHCNSDVFTPEKNTLSSWLVERYCLWETKGQKLLKGPIWHKPWQLQKADVSIKHNELMTHFPNTDSTQAPLAHYGGTKDVLFYPFQYINNKSP